MDIHTTEVYNAVSGTEKPRERELFSVTSTTMGGLTLLNMHRLQRMWAASETHYTRVDEYCSAVSQNYCPVSMILLNHLLLTATEDPELDAFLT